MREREPRKQLLDRASPCSEYALLPPPNSSRLSEDSSKSSPIGVCVPFKSVPNVSTHSRLSASSASRRAVDRRSTVAATWT